jgi:hypothetical protein
MSLRSGLHRGHNNRIKTIVFDFDVNADNDSDAANDSDSDDDKRADDFVGAINNANNSE